MLPPLEPIRFENEGLNLYGMLHRPAGDGPYPLVAFCHGFTGQRYEPGWIFVRAARRLASIGIAAFRFDFRYSGDSDGDFRDMTISSEISDACRVVDVLKTLPDVDPARLGLVGMSMGGTVAAETAARRDDIRSLCLWCPVSDPSAQFSDLARRLLDGEVDLGPAVLGPGFGADLHNHHPVEATRRWGGPLRVIHGTADTTVDIACGRAYLDGPDRREMVEVEGATHAWWEAHNQERVCSATAEWFLETL